MPRSPLQLGARNPYVLVITDVDTMVAAVRQFAEPRAYPS